MHDIKLILTQELVDIDFTRKVEDKELYIQKSLVNIATLRGDDLLYPDRGTTLLYGALGGSIVSETSANHIANFSALDTLFFVREYEYASLNASGNLISNLEIVFNSASSGAGVAKFDILFTYTDGTSDTTTLETLV